LAVGVDICETAIKFSLKRNCFQFEDKKSFLSWIGSLKRERTTFTCKISQIKNNKGAKQKQKIPKIIEIEEENIKQNEKVKT
jgi:hypothetical protein